MAKTKDYFSHDYYARADLRGVLKDYGLQGIGFYWCFVEILHENCGTVKETDLDSIAFELRADLDMCQAIIQKYGLFKSKAGKITNDRVRRNLKKRSKISEARKSAAEARWSSPKNVSDEDTKEGVAGHRTSEATKEKSSHTEAVKEYKDWFAEKLDKFEAEAVNADDYDEHPIWLVSNIFKNIVDEVSRYPALKIARKSIKTSDFLATMQHFMRSRQHLEELAEVIREVNEKAEQGKIENKQNYLIAALYQAARVNGG